MRHHRRACRRPRTTRSSTPDSRKFRKQRFRIPPSLARRVSRRRNSTPWCCQPLTSTVAQRTMHRETRSAAGNCGAVAAGRSLLGAPVDEKRTHFGFPIRAAGRNVFLGLRQRLPNPHHRQPILRLALTGHVSHCVGAMPPGPSRKRCGVNKMDVIPALEFAARRRQPKTNDEFPHPTNQCDSGGGLRHKHRNTFSPCEITYKTWGFVASM
jgi:hypothetical protein